MTKSMSIASGECVCATLGCLKDLLSIWGHALDGAGTSRRCPAPEASRRCGLIRARLAAGIPRRGVWVPSVASFCQKFGHQLGARFARVQHHASQSLAPKKGSHNQRILGYGCLDLRLVHHDPNVPTIRDRGEDLVAHSERGHPVVVLLGCFRQRERQSSQELLIRPDATASSQRVGPSWGGGARIAWAGSVFVRQDGHVTRGSGLSRYRTPCLCQVLPRSPSPVPSVGCRRQWSGSVPCCS